MEALLIAGIVIGFLTMVICLITLLDNDNEFPVAAALLGAGVLAISMGILGERKGEDDLRLPDLGGLCKAAPGSAINVSWKASEDDVEKLQKSLNDDAKCTVKVVQIQTPPAFPTRKGEN